MNPRAAINDLLPFQGSPFGQLGYFSKLPYLLSSSDIYLCRSQRQVILYLVCFMLSSTFFTFFKSFYSVFDKRREWDSNPRALADKRFSRPPRYDHFDISPYTLFSVRRVSVRRKMYSIIKSFCCQYKFLHFFDLFQKYFSNVQILRCCDLNILIGALYKSYSNATFLFYYHGIIRYRSHILFTDTLVRFLY